MQDGKKDKRPHKERVLDYLMSKRARKRGATICEINEALRIGDARERIRDLRADGHLIETRHTDAEGAYHSWGTYYYHFPPMTRGEALDKLDGVRDSMTPLQYKTIRGQILAGDIDGALAGMRVMLHRAGAL